MLHLGNTVARLTVIYGTADRAVGPCGVMDRREIRSKTKTRPVGQCRQTKRRFWSGGEESNAAPPCGRGVGPGGALALRERRARALLGRRRWGVGTGTVHRIKAEMTAAV